MTALGTYYKLVIKGTGPASEIWQTGLSLVSTVDPSTQAAIQADANTLQGFVATWYTAIKSFLYTSYNYTGVSLYQYIAPSTTAHLQANVPVAAVPGTLATAGSPIDTATVVSIRSADPSRRGRNRLYVPDHTTCAAATGMRSTTSTSSIGTATKALFTAIVGSSTYAPIVISRTGGKWEVPLFLDTDNKPDVQRRRENRLLPTSTQVLAFP